MPRIEYPAKPLTEEEQERQLKEAKIECQRNLRLMRKIREDQEKRGLDDKIRYRVFG